MNIALLFVGIFGLIVAGVILVLWCEVRDARRSITTPPPPPPPPPPPVQTGNPVFDRALANAPDSFTAARAALAARHVDPAIANGDRPDMDAPRFVWFTTAGEAATVDPTVLPPWLAGTFARRCAVTWAGDSIWTHPDLGDSPTAYVPGADGVTVTARELPLVLSLPGRVTDATGGPVLPPKWD